MFSIIVMTHGKFATGIKDTITMVAGDREYIYYVTFEPSDTIEELEKKVRIVYHSIPKDQKVLFLTDMFGGTPANVATSFYLKDMKRVQVIVGFNLPLLLSVIFSHNSDLFDIIDNLIEETREQIKKIQVLTCVNDDDE